MVHQSSFQGVPASSHLLTKCAAWLQMVHWDPDDYLACAAGTCWWSQQLRGTILRVVHVCESELTWRRSCLWSPYDCGQRKVSCQAWIRSQLHPGQSSQQQSCDSTYTWPQGPCSLEFHWYLSCSLPEGFWRFPYLWCARSHSIPSRCSQALCLCEWLLGCACIQGLAPCRKAWT